MSTRRTDIANLLISRDWDIHDSSHAEDEVFVKPQEGEDTDDPIYVAKVYGIDGEEEHIIGRAIATLPQSTRLLLDMEDALKDGHPWKLRVQAILDDIFRAS